MKLSERIIEARAEMLRWRGKEPSRMYLGMQEIMQMQEETKGLPRFKMTPEEVKASGGKLTYMNIEWYPVNEPIHFFMV